MRKKEREEGGEEERGRREGRRGRDKEK